MPYGPFSEMLMPTQQLIESVRCLRLQGHAAPVSKRMQGLVSERSLNPEPFCAINRNAFTTQDGEVDGEVSGAAERLGKCICFGIPMTIIWRLRSDADPPGQNVSNLKRRCIVVSW